MRKIIISVILCIIIIVFASISKVWSNSMFIVWSSLFALSIYWHVELIVDYVYYYKRENLTDRFNLYIATILNSSAVTLENIKANEAYYYKKFQRSLFKEKFVDVFKVLIALSIAVMALIMFICAF